MSRDRRWWREPVFHFILIGALLIFLQALATPAASRRSIVISSEVVRGLRAAHARRTGSLPSPEEEAALIEDHIRNETLYREALALGLDKGDVVVRRRLIQKMQFLLEDEELVGDPSDEELETFLTANETRYAEPAKVAISHVFASSDRHADPRTAAEAFRKEILAGHSPDDLGDPFLRGRELPLSSESSLAGVFGPELAAAVIALPVGTWSKPIRSSYGFHLVLVRDRQPSRPGSLATSRLRVLRDWRATERQKANERALARLRTAYDVRVESEEAGT